MRKHEITDEQLDVLRRRLAFAQEIVASVGTVGELRPDELASEVDVGECARAAVKDTAGLAEREGVEVVFRVQPEGSRGYVRRAAKAIGVLAREIISQAIAASPRGSKVEVTVVTSDPQTLRLFVDDAGPALPASARRSFLTLETHAGAYGRPSGLPIFMAAEIATCIGATLELSDASSGGLRVSVTFAKS
jgi:two-component system sensor histidine kinase TctE